MEQPTNGELPLLAMIRKPYEIELAQVESFGDDEETAVKRAITWAWQARRVKSMSQAHASELLDMQPQHFSNVLTGKKYLPLHKLNAFEQVVGNTAVTQTIRRFAGLREKHVTDQVAQLVAEHLARVA